MAGYEVNLKNTGGLSVHQDKLSTWTDTACLKRNNKEYSFNTVYRNILWTQAHSKKTKKNKKTETMYFLNNNPSHSCSIILPHYNDNNHNTVQTNYMVC